MIKNIIKSFRADNKKLAAKHKRTMQEAEAALRQMKAAMDKIRTRKEGKKLLERYKQLDNVN